MKIKLAKTKRQFLDAFAECDHLDEEDALALADAFGAEFREEPKEPELAKRIYVGGAGLWTHDADMTPRRLTWAEEREAAARYNAAGNILRHDEGLIHVDHLDRVLHRERQLLGKEGS